MTNTHSLDLESTLSQYASISDVAQTGLGLTGDNTIEFWVNIESANEDTGIVTKQASFTSAGYSVEQDNLKLQLIYRSSGGNLSRFLTTNDVLTIGVWQHIAVVFDASAPSVVVYVNGISVAITNIATSATSIGTNSNDFVIGGRYGSGSYFDGLIDEVRVWNDIRTQAEIRDNAGIELVGNEAGLQGYWKLNNDYTDETANLNDLAASGSPVFSTDIPWEEATAISGSTNLETNLVSHWEMEEASGTRVDSKGSNDLTDNNTVGQGTGIQGNCADFEKTNLEYLSLADVVALRLTGNFTISTWIKAESIPASNSPSIIAKETSALGWNLRLNHSGAGSKISALANAGTDGQLISTTTIVVGNWYHIVVSYDGITACLYIDGVKESTTTTWSVSSTTALLNVGRSPTSTDRLWDGIVDETGIYSRALHYGDVLDLYNAGVGIPYSGGATVPANSNFLMFM